KTSASATSCAAADAGCRTMRVSPIPDTLRFREVEPVVAGSDWHNRRMPNRCRLLLLIPIIALAPALAGAAESTAPAAAAGPTPAPTQAPNKLPDWAPKPRPNVIEDRFRVEVNLLYAQPSTKLRVDESPTLPGTEISAEDDLGLDDSQLLPQVELTLLPGE